MPRVYAIDPETGRMRPPVRDDRHRPVIQYTVESGLLGRWLLSPPHPNWAEAEDGRKGIYRSARYFCGCGDDFCTRNNSQDCPDGGQRVGARADVVKDKDGKLRVQFKLHDKAEARRYMIERYGPDPNLWPYNPRRKQLKRKP